MFSNTQTSTRRTPLSRAAELRHTIVIRQLANSKRLIVFSSCKDDTGLNSFTLDYWAWGLEKVISMLIEYNVDEEDDLELDSVVLGIENHPTRGPSQYNLLTGA